MKKIARLVLVVVLAQLVTSIAIVLFTPSGNTSDKYLGTGGLIVVTMGV